MAEEGKHVRNFVASKGLFVICFSIFCMERQAAWGSEARLWQVYYHCSSDFDCLLLIVLLIYKKYKQDQLLPLTPTKS